MDYNNLKIPNHVAIILDGNGRWATERGLSRSEGHKAGYENLKKLSEYVFNKGIKILSVFVFSTENFKRSKEEVDFLMDLFLKKFKGERHFYKDRNIKIIFSGRKEPLSDKVYEAMKTLEEETKNNTGGILNICLNYGGRAEIVDATKKICMDVKLGKIEIDKLDEETYQKYLYQDLESVDLLIRTSGELRLSNFLLWQLSYAEFYFPKTYFPAFNEDEFDKAIIEYTNRDRRYGGINYEKKSN